MPLLSFTDFEAYADALAGVDGLMRVTGPVGRAWTLDILDAGDVTAMLGVDGAPALYNGLSQPGRYVVHISLPGSDAFMQGSATADDQFVWFAPGVEVHGFTRTQSKFIALDLDTTAVVQRAREVAELFDDHIDRTYAVNVGRVEMAPVITLVTRALAIHRQTPACSTSPACAGRSVARSSTRCCAAWCWPTPKPCGAPQGGRHCRATKSSVSAWTTSTRASGGRR